MDVLKPTDFIFVVRDAELTRSKCLTLVDFQKPDMLCWSALLFVLCFKLASAVRNPS